MAHLSKGITVSVTGVTTFRNPHAAPQERDLDADLAPHLAALRHLDGDGSAALVLPLPDEQRARIAREMVRRRGLFPSGAVRAVLASTPKPVLVSIMGLHAAAVAWRTYVADA